MKCQILFTRKNKKNIVSLSSAEPAHILVSVKVKVFSDCKETMKTPLDVFIFKSFDVLLFVLIRPFK